MPSNACIAHEDRRVVVTQQPKASGLKIVEILIQGDLHNINTAASGQPCKTWRSSRDVICA